MSRPRRFLAALPGVLGVLSLLAGLPLALVWWVGYPLPRHMPNSAQWRAILDHPVTNTSLIDATACIIWVLWLALLYVVVATVVSTVAKIRLPVPRFALSMRAALGSLVGASVIATTTGAALPAAVAAHAPAVAEPGVSAGPQAQRDGFVGPATAPPTPAAPSFAVAGFDGQMTVRTGNWHYTVTVRRHDTLWDIARTWLGNPDRWPEIYQLNRAHYDQHGRMRHGNLILPGWILVLPDDATPPPGAAPAHTGTPSGRPNTVQPGTSTAPSPTTEPHTTPDPGTGPTTGLAPTSSATGSPRPVEPTTSATPTGTRQVGAGVDLGERGWVTPRSPPPSPPRRPWCGFNAAADTDPNRSATVATTPT